MKALNDLLTFALVHLTILLACTAADTVAISTLTAKPQGWSKITRPLPTRLLKFHLCLRPHNIQNLEDHLFNLSTPGHESYGQHLAREVVQTYLKPADNARSSIESWLGSHDVTHLQQHGSSHFTFSASVEQAESLLNTKFHIYRNNRTGRLIIRSLSYSVPASIRHHIQMIQPTTRFDDLRAQFLPVQHDDDVTRAAMDADERFDRSVIISDASQTYEPRACNISITPGCLRGLYGLENVNATDNEDTYGLGISGFLNQYVRVLDWQLFKRFHAPWVDEHFLYTIALANGTVNLEDDRDHDSLEAQLDIQYAMSLAPHIKALYILTPGLGPLLPDNDQPSQEHNSNEPYLDQLTTLLNMPLEGLPRVISYSYGENEQSVPFDYATQVCTMFGLLSLRGVSIIFASGDSGPGNSCMSNREGVGPRLNAQFPASCPWVTSVGGTTNVEPEIGAYFSSGGFSDYFPTPKYQEGIPQQYLRGYDPLVQQYTNISGRAFPDVSAQAIGFHVVDKGLRKTTSGTSASAPVFAAVVANLNRIRWEQGKSSLGFLNPWLYSLEGKGFTDITDGNSEGCTIQRGTDVLVPRWYCSPGWDAVTGLGTPVFEELAQAMPR